MTKLLYIYESYEPTNAEFYNLILHAKNYAEFEVISKECMKITPEDLQWCDVIISVRSTSEYEWRLAKYAKSLGKYWALMIDDDFLSLRANYGKDGQGYRPKKKKCLLKILQYVDCLVVVNDLLGQKYIRLCNTDRYILTNTSFDISHMESPHLNSEKVKIVYYVNDGTQEMFDLYLRTIFPKLCAKYADKIELYFMAVKPNMDEYEGKLKYYYVPHMSYEAFLTYMREQHFDIGLAPLDDRGFSKYKYFNKYVEYTRAGIAGIYTDCALYRQVIQSDYNGILCDNSAESWIMAIEKLVDNPDIRIRIAENAQKYASENFGQEEVTRKFLQNFPEMASYKAPEKNVSQFKFGIIRIHYYFFTVGGWMYTIWSCIRNGNIKSLIPRFRSKILKRSN